MRKERGRKMKIYIKTISMIMILSVLFTFLSFRSFAANTLDWEIVLGYGGYNSIVSSSNMCVAVGDYERIMVSEDGVNWTAKNLDLKSNLNGVAWNGTKFVAVGSKGTILASTDGQNWNKVQSGTTYDLNSIVWNGKIFVATGGDQKQEEGVIFTSPDAAEWTVRSKPGLGFISSIAYNNVFLAIEAKDSNDSSKGGLVLKSADGIEWEETGLDIPGHDIVSFKGNFLAGSNIIKISKDGLNWDASYNNEYTMLNRIYAAGDVVLAVSSRYGKMIYTTNGTDWTQTHFGDIKEEYFNGITFFKGNYIGIRSDGTVWLTSDFKTWQEQKSKKSLFFNSVASNGSTTLVVGRNGEAYISSDDLNWNECSTGTETDLQSVLWDGAKYVVLDNEGGIHITSDGTEWDLISTINNIGDSLKIQEARLSFAGSKYYLSSCGPFLTSSNLKDWKKVNFAMNDRRSTDVTANGKIIVAVGYDGTILTSTNGETWTKRNSWTKNNLNRIIWDGRQFVAVGEWNTVVRSSDGIKWDALAENKNDVMSDIIWNGKEYLSAYDYGKIAGFDNLKKWNKTMSENDIGVSSILWNGYRYIAAGSTIKTAIPENLVKVVVDGRPIVFDVAPQIANDSALIPVRAVFEALGAHVQWDGKTQTVTVSNKDTEIYFKIGEKTAQVNEKTVNIATPAVIIGNKTFAPIRFIAENLNMEVTWDKDTNTVFISTK